MAIFDQSKFETNVTNGIATVAYSDKDAFKNGTDIPLAEMKRTFDYAQTYLEEAATESAGVATKIMEDDKSVDKVIIEYPYGISKRGNVTVTAKREQTFKSPADPTVEVVKSTLAMAVKDPLTKVSKSKIQDLTKTMTAKLLS